MMSWLLFAAALLGDAQAGQIVAACAVRAEAKRQSHAIAVVDSGGRLLAFRRMDGNVFGIGDLAREKAVASAAWGGRTSQLAQSAATTPGFASAPNVVTVGGGVAVFASDGTLLGGVGVSGEAPADDEACAIAGIEAAGLLAARPRR